jgi:hypothetical protein
MRNESAACRMLAIFLCFSLLSGGCTTLKKEDYAQFGYKGQAATEEGKKVWLVDGLGNFFGAFSKLILWNWKVERHNIQTETKDAVDQYLKEHESTLGNVMVQLNRYAPQDSWRRLFQNKGVKWPYRYFLGIFSVLIVDTLLPGRIFGGDRYDPFTHTVHLYSDLPSIALHELGHAEDFAERRYRGSYALFRMVPFADLYQEHKATEFAFQYVRAEKMVPTEIECYKVLYPAYGTYIGSYLYSFGLLAVIVGHIWGRSEAHALEKQQDLPKITFKAA